MRDFINGACVFIGAWGAVAWLAYGMWIMAHGAAEIELMACMLLAVGVAGVFAIVHGVNEWVWTMVKGY